MRNYVRQVVAVFLLGIISANSYALDVTFLNPGKQGERFWDMVTETMQAAADDLGINLEVLYAGRNRIMMRELGLEVTRRSTPPDYLILVNEEQAIEPVFLSASQRNIKTLMLLNDFSAEQRQRIGDPGSKYPNLLGALTPDNFAAGERMMQALYSCAQQKGEGPYHVLALGGDRLTPASLQRNEGALAVVKQQPAIQLDRFLYANWNQQRAESLTDLYLQWAQRNDVRPHAIWAANDPIALGAKQALLKHDLLPGKDVCLAGLNWSKPGLDMVVKGEMEVTDGGHFLAGGWAMVMLHDHAQRLSNGNASPIGDIRFQMQAINHSNISAYLNKLGAEQWQLIDYQLFKLRDGQSFADYDFSLQNLLACVKE